MRRFFQREKYLGRNDRIKIRIPNCVSTTVVQAPGTKACGLERTRGRRCRWRVRRGWPSRQPSGSCCSRWHRAGRCSSGDDGGDGGSGSGDGGRHGPRRGPRPQPRDGGNGSIMDAAWAGVLLPAFPPMALHAHICGRLYHQRGRHSMSAARGRTERGRGTRGEMGQGQPLRSGSAKKDMLHDVLVLLRQADGRPEHSGHHSWRASIHLK